MTTVKAARPLRAIRKIKRICPMCLGTGWKGKCPECGGSGYVEIEIEVRT